MSASPKQFFVPIDLQKLEIQNAVIQNLSSAPSSPVEGQFYYNTTSHTPLVYNGTSFVSFGGGTVDSVVAGFGINVDSDDAANPIVSIIIGDIIDDGSTSTSTTWSSTYINQQIQAATAGLVTKGSALAATTGALPAYTYANGSSGVGATLTGNSNGALAAQDGVTLTLGQILLVKNETSGNAPYNGIYTLTQVGDVSTPYILTRDANFNSTANIVPNSYVFVSTGTTLHDTGWILNLDGTATVGTTNIVFTQFSGAGTYTQGNGITISSQVISVNYDNSSIGLNGSSQLAVLAGGVTNAMLAGSIADSKLSTISTANKVSGSAVQLNAAGAIINSTGLFLQTDGSTLDINGSNQVEVKAGGIGATQLASSSVTTVKIASAAVTYDKLGNKYEASFVSGDFSSGDLTIAAGTHGLGATADLVVTVKNASKVDVTSGVQITYADSGDVVISVTTGLEFSGRIIIVRP